MKISEKRIKRNSVKAITKALNVYLTFLWQMNQQLFENASIFGDFGCGRLCYVNI